MNGHWQWSVRREVWENRSLYLAPLAIAAIALVANFVRAGRFAESVRALPTLEGSKQVIAAVVPYGLTAAVILLTGWIVAMFYSLDALNGERRDRTILFWKSMPVSDLTTVLAKASVALVLVPLVVCAIAFATQFIMLVMHGAVLLAKGIDPGTLWSRLPFFGMWGAIVYGMAVHALWYAPIVAYLLLVSVMVRRAAFLWAILPFIAAYAVETIAFGSQHVAQFLKFRLLGAMTVAFRSDAMKEPVPLLDPLGFLSSPGLWIGLAFAAAFLAAAVRLRRYREPI
jgi:ABC-2 type transport system permease protein